jgi:hypothetical protein
MPLSHFAEETQAAQEYLILLSTLPVRYSVSHG